jgi:hypothetical protein
VYEKRTLPFSFDGSARFLKGFFSGKENENERKTFQTVALHPSLRALFRARRKTCFGFNQKAFRVGELCGNYDCQNDAGMRRRNSIIAYMPLSFSRQGLFFYVALRVNKRFTQQKNADVDVGIFLFRFIILL